MSENVLRMSKSSSGLNVYFYSLSSNWQVLNQGKLIATRNVIRSNNREKMKWFSGTLGLDP